jgi:hypothetical protein
MNEHNLSQELNRLLNDGDYRTEMLRGFKEIINLLGDSGASGRAASAIAGIIKKTSAS